MIFIVSQYVFGFTCHNESMLIGLFRQRQFADERKWLFVSADDPLGTSVWEATFFMAWLVYSVLRAFLSIPSLLVVLVCYCLGLALGLGVG